MATFERQIASHEREIQQLQERREYFIRQFGAYWASVSKEAPAAAE